MNSRKNVLALIVFSTLVTCVRTRPTMMFTVALVERAHCQFVMHKKTNDLLDNPYFFLKIQVASILTNITIRRYSNNLHFICNIWVSIAVAMT